MTASPMNFSTVPPWRSMTPRISAKYRVITSWRASGSRRSPSAVKPLTSANTTVTVLRAWRSPTAGPASDDPQAKQNLAPSTAASPHLGHAAMGASLAWGAGAGARRFRKRAVSRLAACPAAAPRRRWLVDGMNVIGSRPDGWWRDRTAAMRRLTGELDALAGRPASP